MKVLLLPDNLYEYLNHVIRAHAGAGIDPEEGLAIYQLNQSVGQAQTVDVSSLGKVKLDKLGPDGVSMTIVADEPEPESDRLDGIDPEISGRN